MKRKLLYLQVFRGIAALLVVLVHTTGMANFYMHFNPVGGIFGAGWNAVDFFFVLSGFIIFFIHSRDLGKPSEWTRYFSKRLIRIYPIYWVISLVALTFLVVGNANIANPELTGLVSRPSYIIKSLLLIPQKESPFYGIAWSLVYEMFFYVVFGIGILFGRVVLWLCIGLYFLLLGYTLLGPSTGMNPVLSFLSSNYNLEFLLGVLTAWCFKTMQSLAGNPLKTNWPLRCILLSGLALFAIGWYFTLARVTTFGKFSIESRLVYGIASAMIIFSIAHFDVKKTSGLWHFSLLLGDASYVIYLVHPLVAAILYKLIEKSGLEGHGLMVHYSWWCLSVLACVGVGILIHKKVEKVILDYLNRCVSQKRYVPDHK